MFFSAKFMLLLVGIFTLLFRKLIALPRVRAFPPHDAGGEIQWGKRTYMLQSNDVWNSNGWKYSGKNFPPLGRVKYEENQPTGSSTVFSCSICCLCEGKVAWLEKRLYLLGPQGFGSIPLAVGASWYCAWCLIMCWICHEWNQRPSFSGCKLSFPMDPKPKTMFV